MCDGPARRRGRVGEQVAASVRRGGEIVLRQAQDARALGRGVGHHGEDKTEVEGDGVGLRRCGQEGFEVDKGVAGRLKRVSEFR